MIGRLTCCEQGGKFIGLRHEWLCREYDSSEDFLQKMRETPPLWTMHVKTFVTRREHADQGSAHVSFCPFCGTKVPGVRLRKNPPKKICVILDGGYYCATCEERLDSCDCALPARMWEAVS
jgi:hypothetical protein